jgi:hypothetical protein
LYTTPNDPLPTCSSNLYFAEESVGPFPLLSVIAAMQRMVVDDEAGADGRARFVDVFPYLVQYAVLRYISGDVALDRPFSSNHNTSINNAK